MKRMLKFLLVGTTLIMAFQSNVSLAEGSKKESKAVVIFKDGSVVTEEEVKKELDNVPQQMSSQMSLDELKKSMAWYLAYQKVMNEVVKKSSVCEKKDVKSGIEKRKNTVAGFMLLEAKAKESMTQEALKKHYDKTWDENFKNTKEFSLIAITTADKAMISKIKESAKDGESLKKFLDSNNASVKHMEMENRPQGIFPPEISSAVLKQGKGSVIGPFNVKGAFMLFYVKDLRDAKKQEFTKEFEENYKKTALRDFTQEYMKELYKKYKVKILDINGEEVDPFKIIDKKANNAETDKKKAKPADLTKIKDDFVLATMDGEKVTVSDIKKFFKVESLVDEAFVSMAQQFQIKPEEVVIYAVKLATDDRILTREVKATKYDDTSEAKEKLQKVEEMEYQHAFYKENVKVTAEDTRKAFSNYIKSIPEEEKNDHEISTKMLFFETQEDAAAALKSIKSGEEKFSSIFKEKQSKGAVDLGYVKKRGVAPEVWNLLKKGASGTCCDQIVAVEGSNFGFTGLNYAIVYIADRRPVTLPTLSDPSVKNHFQMLAEREKAGKIAETHLLSKIKTIEERPIEDFKKNPEYMDRILSFLVGFAGL